VMSRDIVYRCLGNLMTRAPLLRGAFAISRVACWSRHAGPATLRGFVMCRRHVHILNRYVMTAPTCAPGLTFGKSSVATARSRGAVQPGRGLGNGHAGDPTACDDR